MESMRNLLVAQVKEKEGVGALSKSMVDVLKEKLAELLHVLQDAIGFLVEKLDHVFPPETRAETLHHWLRFGLTVILPVALVLLCLCCCCCSSGPRRMMKAPGRRGALIPRATFEGDPRGYFINLRAKKDLVF